MFVNVEIGIAGHLSNADMLEPLQAVVELAADPSTSISLSIGGFENDPREIFEIPEARQYLLIFAAEALKRGVPTERFIPTTVSLIAGCLVAHEGGFVELDGHDHLTDDILEHLGRMKKTLH
jgi:hypothetical protein